SSLSVGAYAQSVMRAKTLARPSSSTVSPSISTVAEPASGSTANSSPRVAIVRLSSGSSRTTRRPQYVQPADSGVITGPSPSARSSRSDADTCPLEERAYLVARRHRVGAEEAGGDDRSGRLGRGDRL